ncbi:hypothetical protein SeMB42_g06717 [Synchytrium endobioticum]|uniref:Uncharacterized protein n=1 Tax=Synchytrium endobioticum TaxID=286115 RepID=A0A507CGW5_9FUNG|nr:hypothetical protein SeMB42_g06717 [Synchytrium endobioticum]TPX46931.1 hypothetical protein SeLEV6574_g02939 [Synchytrium endobioticum]
MKASVGKAVLPETREDAARNGSSLGHSLAVPPYRSTRGKTDSAITSGRRPRGNVLIGIVARQIARWASQAPSPPHSALLLLVVSVDPRTDKHVANWRFMRLGNERCFSYTLSRLSPTCETQTVKPSNEHLKMKTGVFIACAVLSCVLAANALSIHRIHSDQIVPVHTKGINLHKRAIATRGGVLAATRPNAEVLSKPKADDYGLEPYHKAAMSALSFFVFPLGLIIMLTGFWAPAVSMFFVTVSFSLGVLMLFKAINLFKKAYPSRYENHMAKFHHGYKKMAKGLSFLNPDKTGKDVREKLDDDQDAASTTAESQPLGGEENDAEITYDFPHSQDKTAGPAAVNVLNYQHSPDANENSASASLKHSGRAAIQVTRSPSIHERAKTFEPEVQQSSAQIHDLDRASSVSSGYNHLSGASRPYITMCEISDNSIIDSLSPIRTSVPAVHASPRGPSVEALPGSRPSSPGSGRY